MILILASIMAIGVILAVVAGPKVAGYLDSKRQEAEWNKLAEFVDKYGTPEQKAKAAALRRREVEMRLQVTERRQAHEVLSSPDVRKLLEEGGADVELLNILLDPTSTETESERKLRLLEEKTDQRIKRTTR